MPLIHLAHQSSAADLQLMHQQRRRDTKPDASKEAAAMENGGRAYAGEHAPHYSK